MGIHLLGIPTTAPLAYGFMIPVLDALYKRLATRLNKWENHKLSLHAEFFDYESSIFQTNQCFLLVILFCIFRSAPIFATDSQLASFMVAGQVLSNTKNIGAMLKVSVKQLMSTRQLKKAVDKSSL